MEEGADRSCGDRFCQRSKLKVRCAALDNDGVQSGGGINDGRIWSLKEGEHVTQRPPQADVESSELGRCVQNSTGECVKTSLDVGECVAEVGRNEPKGEALFCVESVK